MKVIDSRRNPNEHAGIGDVIVTDKNKYYLVVDPAAHKGGKILLCGVKVLDLQKYTTFGIGSENELISVGYKFVNYDEEEIIDIVAKESVELHLK